MEMVREIRQNHYKEIAHNKEYSNNSKVKQLEEAYVVRSHMFPRIEDDVANYVINDNINSPLLIANVHIHININTNKIIICKNRLSNTHKLP